eukprot:Skav228915  [mRNA]  locus=scaffold2504:77607:77993:+ [translate_table: standard]
MPQPQLAASLVQAIQELNLVPTVQILQEDNQKVQQMALIQWLCREAVISQESWDKKSFEKKAKCMAKCTAWTLARALSSPFRLQEVERVPSEKNDEPTREHSRSSAGSGNSEVKCQRTGQKSMFRVCH